jgi:hypothetical protein
MDGPALSSSQTPTRSPNVLVPYDVRESVWVACAAKIAGRSQTTIRGLCRQHHIGRRIGGAWSVSRIALQMFLDGDLETLAAYHDGARAQYEPVARYYRRLGLGELLKRQDFGA